jgi:pantoate--beta-alanine ligase
MKSLITMESLRAWRKKLTGKVVFVPTMGALHHGHEALIARARRLAGPKGSVVVSIFLNPIQFGPREDIAAYPKPLKNDLLVCRRAGADAVFLPTVADMYGPDRSVFVDEESLSSVLCGRSRPGHFRGVCTVVAKLFNIVQPTHAIFGEKDWQQLAIIRRMVRDLNFPLEIVASPTVRESDGLAASSRNAYLTPEERALAPQIHAAMQAAATKLKDPVAIVKALVRVVEKIPKARLDYAEAVEAVTLDSLKNRKSEGRLAVAVFLGKARLIDNIPLPPLK